MIHHVSQLMRRFRCSAHTCNHIMIHHVFLYDLYACGFHKLLLRPCVLSFLNDGKSAANGWPQLLHTYGILWECGMHTGSEHYWERARVWCRHRPHCTRALLWHQGGEDRPAHPGLRSGPIKDLHCGHSQVEVAMEGQVFSWWVHGCLDVPSDSGLYPLLLEKAASSESLSEWWTMAENWLAVSLLCILPISSNWLHVNYVMCVK